ncbi:MAG: hypothetical protein NZ765_00935 [Anaerolineae bacterium]|nr:hypothetical protein [Anaerolineae bacterium]MDW8069893.1 hypothetical protein [Anaerolineae bacterium]
MEAHAATRTGHAPHWVWAWSSILIALSCLPYLVAWAATPVGHQFTGLLVNPLDGHSYLAKMRQGWEGAWVFQLRYTPEPHAGAAIFLFYLALGHVARWTGLPLIAVYHLARVSAGLALFAALHTFVGRLTEERSERRRLVLLASSSAGLGWLGVMVGLFPIDLWVPEAFAFLSLLANPHFPLALGLQLFLLQSVLWPKEGRRGWLLPGLAGTALAIVAPFALPVLYVVFAAHLLWPLWSRHARDSAQEVCTPLRGAWKAALSATLASLPWLAYDLLVYTIHPALRAWAQQNVTPTPAPADLLLGFGLLTPLAAVGTWAAARRRDRPALLLAVWSGVTLVGVYVPIALQRRLLIGLGVALAMLAGIGLRHLPRSVTRLAVAFSWLGIGFQLFVFTAGALSAAQGQEPAAALYISADEAAAMQWLSTHGGDAVVLAAPRTGNVLPGQAGTRSFYGHPFETIDATTKAAYAEAFFTGEMSDATWQMLRERYAIRFVFVGPQERRLGARRLPDGLVPVFQQGDVTIYRVP